MYHLCQSYFFLLVAARLIHILCLLLPRLLSSAPVLQGAGLAAADCHSAAPPAPHAGSAHGHEEQVSLVLPPAKVPVMSLEGWPMWAGRFGLAACNAGPVGQAGQLTQSHTLLNSCPLPLPLLQQRAAGCIALGSQNLRCRPGRRPPD